ncbi:Ger(x)C family spore germination C-terminal domain-containing protein, partial [Pseudomonas sp. 2822-15]|uniref:Ger(x)C family spore germination C-terminal domain-containing protein n=1 Tax=Pseudomonas sp. 2822-15 TaxID=1712677 RepID=UPI001C45CD01
KAALLEYIGNNDISNEDNQKKLEKRIEEHMEKEANELVKQLQENNADSLGLGQFVRNTLSPVEWKELNWKEV